MSETKQLKRIKSSLFDRGLSLTKLALHSSAKLAQGGLSGAWITSERREAHLKAMLASQAKLLARELGELKGSLMKVGQLLALYGEHFLPDEVVRSLKSLNQK